MEVSIFYEDRLLSLEERTQGFDIREQPASQNRMRKLQSVLKKYNHQFASQADYFVENYILSQKKLDYYRNIQFQQMNNGSMLLKVNNVVLKQLDDLSRLNKSKGKFHFCIIDTMTYEEYLTRNSKFTPKKKTFDEIIGTSLCCKHITGDSKLRSLDHIRCAYDNKAKKTTTDWHKDFKDIKNLNKKAQNSL